MKKKQTLPPEEWQVGDVVRIVANKTYHSYEIGELICITDIPKDDKFQGPKRGSYEWWFSAEEAEWVGRPSSDLQEQVSNWYKDNIYPLARRLCKTDEGNQESNFGQMLELLNDLADEINREPVTTIRKLVELAELRKIK